MFFKNLENKNIILASGSPRRQELFKILNIPFKVIVKEVNETYSKELKGSEITAFLARKKASEFSSILKEDDIVITSDTIVWFDGKALEKPKNLLESKKMLKQLSNSKHQVYTSICIKTKFSEKVISDETTVYFENLSTELIDYYVTNYKTLDKAGGYGIQDWFGLVGVKKIDGSYYNVMGFPVHKLCKELLKL
jgi:septum formation protein